MLTLRLQRIGRKKLPQYRLVAQEHSLSPKSGRVSAYLGTFNPTSKDFKFDEEAVSTHLTNGAQPSQKVAKLLTQAGMKLPKWVVIHKHPEKKKPEPAQEEVNPVPDDQPKESAAEQPEKADEKPKEAAEPVVDEQSAPTEEAKEETPEAEDSKEPAEADPEEDK